MDNVNLPIEKNDFIELLKLCIKDCKFVFNGKYYSQKFGLAMGNPLSPVLSNLYMEFFETKFLINILPHNAKWLRYVDDVLCLWPCNENLDSFLFRLNNLVPSIKFTLEREIESKIPFLDVLIYRTGHTFKYSVYRKPTNVESYIHFYSSHPISVKKSVFSSMFLRALRICSPEFIDEEIDHIFDIGKNLKYPEYVIQTAFKQARNTFYSSTEKTKFDKNNLLVLPYSTNFENIPKLLKAFQINVVFSNKYTLRNMFIKNSPECTVGSVYKIECRDCDSFYIGQTG